MTKTEAEEWIRRFEAGNDEDKYRTSSNLSIVLRLMLHSHLRPAQIYKLTVGMYKLGYMYKIEKNKELKDYKFKELIINENDNEIIKSHIEKYNLGLSDKLITVSDRALRAKFQNMVSAYYSGTSRPEMVELYYAGIEKENKPMKRSKTS